MLVLALILAGCGDLLTVDNPGSIAGADLDDPGLLEAFLDLPEAAAAEEYDNAVRVIGMVGNDLMEWQTRAGDIWQDTGLLDQSIGDFESLYDGLVSGIWVSREARRRMSEALESPNSHPAMARAHFWEAQMMVTAADVFEGVTFEGGPPQSPVEVYDMALDVLDTAIDIAMSAGGMDELIAASHGTKARIERSVFFELDDPGRLANAAGHAADALAVQSDFQVDARYVPPGKQNTIYTRLGPDRGASPLGVGEIFGEGWVDPVTDEVDPRIGDVVSGPQGTGPNGTLYFELKYLSPDSPIPVSRWQEAVLILAENHLENDELTEAVTEINRVRGDADLPDFDSDDPEAIRDQIIYERQTEFFLEGRSWQDHRYYEIFPVRWTQTARDAGLDRRAPISDNERSTNEHFQ